MEVQSIWTEPAGQPQQVAEIVRETITEIYPHYYPKGAVQFFLDLHSPEGIEKAWGKEEIYLLKNRDTVLGTGSIGGNEICRLFILPGFQGMGFGGRLMDFQESEIFKYSSSVCVDVSFPAEGMYLKRGYRIASFEKTETGNGDFLCYHTMEKRKENIGKYMESEALLF